MSLVKRVYSHPMSWMATVYVVGFGIAALTFGPVALLHPLGFVVCAGPLLYSCRNKNGN